MQEQSETFLNKLFEEIASVGINISGLQIDHIAYSTASSIEYEELLSEFLKQGELIQEALIRDRRVAIIKLLNPITYKSSVIEVMELIEPIKDQQTISGWEHAEFLISNYDEILTKYPDLNWDTKHKNSDNFSRIKLTLPSGLEVKFLDTPVLASTKQEL